VERLRDGGAVAIAEEIEKGGERPVQTDGARKAAARIPEML
jgi:hypothetical protein